MKHLDLEIFSDFSCIGSACPFTCCAGWTILIDPGTDTYYKSVTGSFGDRLQAGIDRESGEYSSFIKTPEGNCPFLNNEKLCDIYINLGEEHLCTTCKIYPRYSYVSGDISFSGVSISCPEVARFYLSHKEPLQIDYKEDNTPIPNEQNIDWTLFNYSVRCFSTCISIAQNRDLTISERLASLILFTSEFQAQIDNHEDPSELIQFFSDSASYSDILKDSCIYKTDLGRKISFIFVLMGFFKKTNVLKTQLTEVSELHDCYSTHGYSSIDFSMVQTACDILKSPDEEIWQEQLLAYGLYRYFMQGLSNRDFYNQFLISFVLIYLFSIHVIILKFIQQGVMPDFDEKLMIIAHISRAIEHSTNICDRALNQLRESGLLSIDSLLKIIS